MVLVKRVRVALCAAVLFISGLGVLSSCTAILGVDTDYGDNPCSSGQHLPPLTCGVGACRNSVPACDANGLPNTCKPNLDQKKDETPDGIDNNCDGLIDEGMPCKDGAHQACYTASTLTHNIGLCHDGLQECKNGVWGSCLADKTPEPEMCDHRDNDCDGVVDNGCPCTKGQEQECYGGAEGTLGTGGCKAGKQQCNDGIWSDCSGDVLPSLELCDGIDNDCDGQIDPSPPCTCIDGAVESCYPMDAPQGMAGVGECTKGTHTCAKGAWGECTGYKLPKQEVCDTKDNDCNGTSDDGANLGVNMECNVTPPVPGTPGTLGPCSIGTTFCGPDGLSCKQTVFAKSETCNGVDDNCDGIPDDHNPEGGGQCVVVGNPQPLGECAKGVVTCEGGKLICKQVNLPAPELCNSKDDDCNGLIDNGNLCCIDGSLNGAETDTDCGGPCAVKCADNLHCIQNFDCLNSVCKDKSCQPPTCNDATKNGTETDVDCGGACPLQCPIGESCKVAKDCTSSVCSQQVCVGPGCTDGVKNGSESDIDCGGSVCSKCTPGQKCKGPQDCDSKICSASSVCQPSSCTDKEKNGLESDTDCGGSCNKCNIGQTCNVPADCTSSVCVGGLCQQPNCADLVLNGSESDIDCGGNCPIKCAVGQACKNNNNDCASNVCTEGFCALKPLGAQCQAANECPGNHCVDGVCCNTDCTDLCYACTQAKKGSGSDGFCAPVGPNAGLNSDCSDQPPCGNNGLCNGSGACQFYPNTTTCSPAVCGADGVTLTAAGKCSGLGGACVNGSSSSCAPALCSNGACKTKCMVDNDCASGAYCKGDICVAKQTDGNSCAADHECSSGSCTDNVCCDLPCKGPCQACTAVKQGAGGLGNGRCGPIAASSDPDNECTSVTPCGTTGECSGFGSCQIFASSTVCQNPTCAPDGVTLNNKRFCDGTSACIDSGTTPCSPYACNGGVCLTSCTVASQCAPNAFCDGLNCHLKNPNGAACTANTDCTSNHCVDQVCCNTACNGTCQACTQAKSGSSSIPDGTCASIATGFDPEAECTDAGANSCGTDGFCSGNGACRFYPIGSPTTQVTGDCKQNQCNGLGQVVSVPDTLDTPADGNQCTSDICAGGVPSNPPVTAGVPCDQNGGKFCNGSGACVQCVVASSCPDQDTNCQARTCVNNTCGFSFTAAGTPTVSQVAGDCKQNQCDGAGNSVPVVTNTDLPDDGKQCTDDVCTNGVPSNPPFIAGTACTQNGGKVCDGNGACVGCVVASTCPGQDTDCQIRSCVSNTCGFSFTASGTPTSTQVPSDCKEDRCNGSGGVVSVPKDTDLPVDNNQCTNDVCTSGVPSNPPVTSGTACTQGGTVCNGTGACVGCVVASTCPGPDTDCQTRSCVNNTCGFSFTASGTPTSTQIPSDCKEDRCNGSGGVVSVPKDTDFPVDGNQCTKDVCTSGVPSNPPVTAESGCNQNGGIVCNGTGTCVQCLVAAHCPGLDTDCQTRSCVNNTCGFTFTTNGTPTSTQVTGDCKEDRCNGSGGVVSVPKDTDLPVDNNQCTNDVCTSGVPSNPPVTSGTACTQGGTVCNGTGACVGCVVASTCPGQDTDCQTRSCVNNTCGFTFTTNGTPTSTQVPSDCKEDRCNGSGGVVSVPKDTDLPVDNNQCTNDVCTSGVPSNPPVTSGTACTQGGTVCNGTGACVGCVVASTCPGQDTDCQTRSCVNNTCGLSFTANGTPTSTQVTGDCKENQCNGSGGVVNVTKNTDLPVDGNQCTSDVCTNGVPSNLPIIAGTACTQNGGNKCDGMGACIPNVIGNPFTNDLFDGNDLCQTAAQQSCSLYPCNSDAWRMMSSMDVDLASTACGSMSTCSFMTGLGPRCADSNESSSDLCGDSACGGDQDATQACDALSTYLLANTQPCAMLSDPASWICMAPGNGLPASGVSDAEAQSISQ